MTHVAVVRAPRGKGLRSRAAKRLKAVTGNHRASQQGEREPREATQ